jgi:hypothetical protein
MPHSIAPESVLEAVAHSLLEPGELTHGVLVDIDARRPTKYLPRTLLAAFIRDTDVIGVWAVGLENILGPIIALDGPAREFTDWGAAATGTSKLEAERIQVLGYPEVKEARAAVAALRQ